MKRKIRNLINVRVIPLTLLTLCMVLTMLPAESLAEESAYTCKINPCYSHPVTGDIEDSGGSASQATGQGMAESALGTEGSLTVGADGSDQLTFTMSLIDYTSGRKFWVQNVGDTTWSKVSAESVGTGSDSNGTTQDYRIQVPSESCIVKVSMYVDPMGRDVVFYFYPSDYTAVSGKSSSGKNSDKNQSSDDGKTETTTDSGSQTEDSAGTAADGTNNSASGSTGTPTSDSTGTQTSDSTGTQTSDSTGTQTSGSVGAADAQGTEISADSLTDSAAEEALGQSSGLSLSTESEAALAVENSESGQLSGQTAHPYLFLFFTIVCSGACLIIMGVLAVHYCRRNWKKWGGTYEDDDEA